MNTPANEIKKDDLYSYRMMKDKRMLVYRNRKLIKMINSKTSGILADRLNGKSTGETHKILAKVARKKI